MERGASKAIRRVRSRRGRKLSLVLEFNRYGPLSRSNDTPGSLWLVPYSLERDNRDFAHHKTGSTLIIGPVPSRLAEHIGSSLTRALNSLGFAVEQRTAADD